MNPSASAHRLFRFRSASENTFAELADGLGWYSRYDCLNDPFEGSYINQTDDSVFDQLIESFRVLCFSQTNDNMLLWTHYADNHRGICIEYEFTNDAYLGQCFPVDYKSNQPILEKVARYPIGVPAAGSLSIHKDKEAKLFLTKSQDWLYEQEYRLLRVAEEPRSPGERRPIPATLTAVYFGLRASQQIVAIVSRLLQDRPSIKFSQAKLVPGHFRLTFDPITRACHRGA